MSEQEGRGGGQNIKFFRTSYESGLSTFYLFEIRRKKINFISRYLSPAHRKVVDDTLQHNCHMVFPENVILSLIGSSNNIFRKKGAFKNLVSSKFFISKF